MRKQERSGFRGTRLVAALILSVVVSGFTGCSLTPLAKHTAAFSIATATVTRRSEDAYRAANRLDYDEQMSSLVLRYDTSGWKPGQIQPLLTADQLTARYAMLRGLRAYAENIAEIENTPRKAEALDSAAGGAGKNLVAVATNLDAALGGNGVSVSVAEQNGLSTAVKALGDFLIVKKVKHELPARIQAMDPTIESICKVLSLDIDALQSFTAREYSNLETQQDLFISRSGGKLNPVEHRAEIRRLPEIERKAQASKELLEALQQAIRQLALTHHALAAAAQGNDPATLQQRIADLQDIGQNLGTYYSSLPAR